jgi:hypothetical protein
MPFSDSFVHTDVDGFLLQLGSITVTSANTPFYAQT